MVFPDPWADADNKVHRWVLLARLNKVSDPHLRGATFWILVGVWEWSVWKYPARKGVQEPWQGLRFAIVPNEPCNGHYPQDLSTSRYLLDWALKCRINASLPPYLAVQGTYDS